MLLTRKAFLTVVVGLYAIGRYVLPHTEGEPKTNLAVY
jgi:hypothetical protein